MNHYMQIDPSLIRGGRVGVASMRCMRFSPPT
jgi:hypothetical protein